MCRTYSTSNARLEHCRNLKAHCPFTSPQTRVSVCLANDNPSALTVAGGWRHFSLTLGAHAQLGLQYLVYLSVTTFSATTSNEQANQRVPRYTCLVI